MKFLCMCEGGNCRSVSLAFALKNAGQDALACGWRFNTAGTREALYEWADLIVLMQPHFIEHVPELHRTKVRVVDVGPDRFGNPFHPELLPFIEAVVQDWAKRDWAV